MKEKLEKSQKYLSDSSVKSSEDFERKIEYYVDITEKHIPYIFYSINMIKSLKEKYSQEHEILSNTLLNIKYSLLQALNIKTQ
jgi:hypothetical protein